MKMQTKVRVPIIGIYTAASIKISSNNSNEDFDTLFDHQATNIPTYIASSYVKYIEMEGAQVIPIFAFSSKKKIAKQLSKINGVLFPGGHSYFPFQNVWFENIKFIIQYAMEQNKNKRTFGVWGICLGFQAMLDVTSEKSKQQSNQKQTKIQQLNKFFSLLTPIHNQSGNTNSLQINQSLDFKVKDQRNGNHFTCLLANLKAKSPGIFQELTSGKGICNFLNYFGVLSSNLIQDKALSNFWEIIASCTSPEPYNETYVAIIQAKQYPFIGVQFHPQKALFQMRVEQQQDVTELNRSFEAVKWGQQLSQLFVNICRKGLVQNNNNHLKIMSQKQLSESRILNYPQIQTPYLTLSNMYIFEEPNPRKEQTNIKPNLSQIYSP